MNFKQEASPDKTQELLEQRIEKLEAALAEYSQRYGLTENARIAFGIRSEAG